MGDELRNKLNKRFYCLLCIHKYTCRLHKSEICFFNPVVRPIILLQVCKSINRHATILSQPLIVKFRKVQGVQLKSGPIYYLLRFTTFYITSVSTLNFRKDLWGDLVIDF